MRPAPILVVGLILIVAVAALVVRDHPGVAIPVIGLAAIGAALALGLVAWAAALQRGAPVEPPHVEDLETARLRELIRGTSLHLREMRYRYSVRMPHATGVDPEADQGFTADVNGIRLGFAPAVITDNRTDEQGLGYVALVYDGRRWRGPGLPCPGGREAALRHAARCVAPLEAEEEAG